MSRNNINIDCQSVRGNLRTYRRREVARPHRNSRPVDTIDDVKNIDYSPVSSSRRVNVKEPVQPVHAVSSMPLTFSPGSEVVRIEPQRIMSEPAQEYYDQQQEVIYYNQEQALSEEVTEAQLTQELAPEELAESYPEVDEVEALIEEMKEQPEEYDYHQDDVLADQLTQINYDEPLIKKKRLKSIKSKKYKFLDMHYVLPSLAVLLFVVGAGVALQSFRTNRNVQAAASGGNQGQQSVNGEDAPDEQEPDSTAFTNYRVAPDAPRYVRIPKIGANNRVVSVGVKANNELKTPGNVFDVGWYENSSKPGQPGATLLDAHVHGPTKPGAFYNLKILTEGDEVEIERGDGKRIKYRVVSKETVPYQQVDMAKAMRSQTKGKNGLNMITCGGKYNKDTKTYEQRVIVYAEQV